jgi:hypothetical protein
MKAKLKLNHEAGSLEEAFGVDEKAAATFIRDTIERSAKVSQAVEYIWSNAATVNLALYCTFILGTYEGAGLALKSLTFSSKVPVKAEESAARQTPGSSGG